jgi:hypothetical protein
LITKEPIVKNDGDSANCICPTLLSRLCVVVKEQTDLGRGEFKISAGRLRQNFSGQVVGVTGFEPVTLRLSSACSNQLSYTPVALRPHLEFQIRVEIHFGGAEGTRTPDLQLAKLPLYQLSYSPTIQREVMSVDCGILGRIRTAQAVFVGVRPLPLVCSKSMVVEN